MKQTKRRGIFYGWWIVVTGTSVWALNAGVYFYGFSTFFTALISEFGWSRTALSLVTSLSRLESGVVGPIVGYLVDKLGTRGLMLAGLVLSGLGYILLSQVGNIEMFTLVFVLVLSVGVSMGTVTPANAAVANWFIRRRSFAFGIMTCGVGVGGLALPLMAWSVNRYGWRSTAVACGVLFLITAVPLSLVMRHKPEPHGYLPDGDVSPAAMGEESTGQKVTNEGSAPVAAVAISSEAADETGFTVKQALASGGFWMLSLAFLARGVVNGGIGVHEIPALENIGFSLEEAAVVLTAMTVLSISGRLVFGWLGDRFDKRYIIAICLGMQSLGLVALAFASDLSLVIVFLAVFSPAYGGTVPLLPAILADYFGRKFFGTINGLVAAVTMWGTILGPVLGGYIFDVSQSYRLAFLLFAAASLVGLVLILLVRKPKAAPVVMALDRRVA